MPIHRLISGNDIKFISVRPPFSAFDFIETHYGEFLSLHRLLSIARSYEFETLTVESIPAKGIIKEENADITQLFPDYSMLDLQRLAFWDVSFNNPADVKNIKSVNLIGYAIIKLDRTNEKGMRWHIFESVLRKYNHKHNYVPTPRSYKVKIAGRQFSSQGVMYCQQNSLNKACAQVALRAVIDGLPEVGTISFRKINRLAGNPPKPGLGLTPPQIQSVLYGLNIPYRAIDYTEGDENGGTNPLRKMLPYRKFVYSGIESGIGALLGFQLTQPDNTEGDPPRHIIPFFGHTFNKDTWVPDAALNYFEIGADIRYIPSDNWTSSFIGHDDNFGSDFCIPKLYIKRNHVDYVVELLKPGIAYSGVQAEAMSLIFLYSLFSKMVKSTNPWMKRLSYQANPCVKKVVLRAISLRNDEYIDHLTSMKDWNENSEDKKLINVLKKNKGSLLPTHLWMIEVSIPHLFPANKRKLGEIILDAGRLPTETQTAVDYDLFVLARLPENYYFIKSVNSDNPKFFETPSQIKTHVPLIKQHS